MYVFCLYTALSVVSACALPSVLLFLRTALLVYIVVSACTLVFFYVVSACKSALVVAAGLYHTHELQQLYGVQQ